MTNERPVCDSCMTAAYDEMPSLTGAEQEMVCIEMGADMPDHLCDSREEPDLGPCYCACNDRIIQRADAIRARRRHERGIKGAIT